MSSKQLDKLKEELEENQKEMININEDLNRNYSSILQPINLDNQCQDIASVFQDNAYKNGVLSLEIMAKNIGEELKYNVIYNNREHCIEEILKLEIASQIPSDDLGQALINAAKEGYANYVLSIISSTDIYSKVDKSDKITALSIAANHLGSCVKFCFEEHNKCHYIQPISSFYQWLSFFKGQCITIQPNNTFDIKGPGHYSEVVALLGTEFYHVHDEL